MSMMRQVPANFMTVVPVLKWAKCNFALQVLTVVYAAKANMIAGFCYNVAVSLVK
jgi:hypothetical protein